MRTSAAILAMVLISACTQTPSYLPPCVDPYSPCTDDASAADASAIDGTAEGGRDSATLESSVPDVVALDGATREGAPAVDAASCTDRFSAALDRHCAADGDCALARHNDCCGTLVMGIRADGQAAFQTAEQAFLACETTCGLRGCFHADLAEDGQTLSSSADGAPRAFVARCDTGRCASHVQ